MPVVLLAFLAAPARALDEYGQMAADVVATAQKAGVRRVAVLRLEAVGGADANGPAVVSERLVSRLAGRPGLQVVERTLLDRVLEEQRLSHGGAVDARDAPAVGRLMGVDAVLTGSLIPQPSGRVEVNLRLISASDARVLGSATRDVKRDWEPMARSDPMEDVVAPPAPRLDVDFTAFWEKSPAAPDPGCAGWERRVDELQDRALPLSTRYWAQRLAAGLDPRTVTRNPGSEIRNLRTRAAFYAGVRRALAGRPAPLSKAEEAVRTQVETAARELVELCDR